MPLQNENYTEFIFLSVCGKFLNIDASICPDTSASVCVAKETKKGDWIPLIKNAGKDIEAKENGNGSIIIQYSNGEKCNNSKELFSTEIMFNCVGYDDDVGEYPTFIANENNCKLFVLWNTPMACPISRYSESKHNCVLKLSDKPDTGLMFDLIPLRQPTWYNVKSEDGRMFQINICGPVINGSCESGASACELNSAGNESIKTLGFFNKSSAHYSVDKGLFFTSKVNKHSVAEVHLVCDVFVHNSNIKFISVNNGIYTFEMSTYLACIYTPVDCVTYDLKGNKFDLNIYRKKTDNWKVTDTRDDHSDVSYYFNVCGELIPNPKIPLFRDRTIASCSVGKDYKRNLGFLNSGPVIQSGSLILRYTDGDACADNTSRYSTLIIFKCSKQDQYPVFVSESESCVVTFLWATPAACPIKSAVGQYCKVREPVYSNLFDLTLLHNEQKDYYINSGRNDSFRINICGSLVKKCAEYTNVSVCLIRDGVEIPIGFKNDRPDYTNGRIMLKFTGSRCQPSANESIVYITFLCDHEPPEPLPSPQFFISDNLCNFYFVWHVREVCPPYQTRSCRMTDSDGLEYDLTPLSLTSNNHMALFKDYYNNTLKFLINVCRSIVFGYGATCEFNAGICMENQTLPNSHNNLVNMGEVNNEMLKFDDGVLSLHYNNGDLCREPAGASLHYSSVIYFYCDWNAVESMPQVIQAKPCTVEFVWNSSVACPLNINTALVPKTGNCTATNPATGFIFNLSSLKDKTYNVLTKYGHFVIAICGNISEECGGVCNRTYPPFGRRSNDTEETAQNYGYGNSDLQYRMRSLYLNYTGGVLCKNNVLRNTIIEFVCGMEHSSEGLEYIEDMDGCTTLFVWTTDLVCEKKKSKCQVNESGIFINLTPLMNSLKNYKATSDDGHVFFINICRPLVPVPKLNCGGSSAVCMADEIPGGDYIDELNLGSPYFEPVFDEGDVILKYFSGTPCLHRSKNSASRDLEYSSSFRFICNVTAGQGSPVLKHIGDCHYDFEWKTNVTCVPGSYDSPKITDKCVIHNSEYNTMIDLRPLFLNDINEIYKVKNQSSVYILNLCGSLTVCNGKRVCKMGTATYSISYGDVCDVEFSYENGNVMKLSYNHGPLCQRNPNLSFSSVVWFRCDPAAGNGTPILLSENETKCFAEFEWRSDIVCKINEKKDKDTTSHTTAGLVVGLLVLFILLFGFFVYCRKPLNRRNFRNKIDVLLGRRRQDILCHYMRESDDGWNEL